MWSDCQQKNLEEFLTRCQQVIIKLWFRLVRMHRTVMQPHSSTGEKASAACVNVLLSQIYPGARSEVSLVCSSLKALTAKLQHMAASDRTLTKPKFHWRLSDSSALWASVTWWKRRASGLSSRRASGLDVSNKRSLLNSTLKNCIWWLKCRRAGALVV